MENLRVFVNHAEFLECRASPLARECCAAGYLAVVVQLENFVLDSREQVGEGRQVDASHPIAPPREFRILDHEGCVEQIHCAQNEKIKVASEFPVQPQKYIVCGISRCIRSRCKAREPSVCECLSQSGYFRATQRRCAAMPMRYHSVYEQVASACRYFP